MSQNSEPADDKRLNKRLKDTPIAIVGMASIFAGSRYLNEFWDLISDEINAITDVPQSHWRTEDYYDSDKSAPDKVYCKRGGFIPDVDFNPMEFGLPPNILELTDTSQLLSLVVAGEVLADANLSDDYDRDRIGITLGIGGGQQISQSMNARLQYPVLRQVFKNSGISDEDAEMLIQKVRDQYVPWEENSFPGSLGNVTAGRVANRFNLGGMNCVADAACAGSLAAVRMALTELTEYRSDMMITGGVDTDNSPYMYMSFSKTPAFTDKQNIAPFDESSSGMMIGEGIGMIAVKRLEDAERDSDKIYAVIKGIGASSDGKYKSIYAPRSQGQAKALNRAYDDAGFAPHSVGLIEAHGTGTAAGDLAEFHALNAVFSVNNDQKQHIALGSIKSQIGHTKATAGTAGLIKAALSLYHKVLPATINVNQPNPKLGVERSPFYINSQTRPWIARTDDTPRRAGISSFGFGGTNFHIVLEEYAQEHHGEYRQRTAATGLLIDAATKAGLISKLEQIQAGEIHLAQLAKQYPHRVIGTSQHRIGFVIETVAELEKELANAIARLAADDNGHWHLPSGTSYQAKAIDGKVAALFAGQGSQYVNMGKALACNFPELRQQVALSDKIFADDNQPALSGRLFPIPAFNERDKKKQQAELTNTAYAQSAIGALSVAQFDLLTKAGFKADLFAGHSFGELSALYAAGVISKRDYTRLAFARGQAMASAPENTDAGSMAAVILPAKPRALEKLHAFIEQCEGVKVANDNSDTQQVIAGSSEAVGACGKAITQKLGFKVIALPVSGAFHTPLVSHAQKPFADAINAAEFKQAQGRVFSNATAAEYPDDAKQIQRRFTEHMQQPVQFRRQVRAMYRAGARVFVEFGPKDILQKLVNANLAEYKDEIRVVSLNPNAKGDSDKQYRQAAMQLAVAGVTLSDIDPYRAEISHPEIAAGMSVKLNGNNYISPATKQKMQASLENGRVSARIEYVDREVEKTVEKVIEKTAESPMTSDKTNQFEQVMNPAAPQPAASGDTLGAFFSAQEQVTRLHQQFLSIPKQYGDTFSELMSEQARMASRGLEIPEALTRSMEMFHRHQSQTLQSHELFMRLQADQNQAALSMLQNGTVPQNTNLEVSSVPAAKPAIAQPRMPSQPQAATTPASPAPQTAAPRPQAAVNAAPPATQAAAAEINTKAPVTESNATLSQTQVQRTMLEVVADKTGYPTDMLDLSMDTEADLGIDSIKRVEILGTVQDELPALPELNAEDLAECRTLGEIVTYMNSRLDDSSTAKVETPSVTAGLGDDQVQQTMLAVVADKTGYPAEMLDLAMDMEADLGIDSIKRVEILGTVQDELPALPELNAEDLAQCRTLGEIVTYMNRRLGEICATSAAEPSTELSSDRVQQTLLDVVADKTGYPAEMLDLAMDMEADLGIDSIKRVEILGTVQDQLPKLAELNAEDLAECRTLGEIVTYMQKNPGSQPVSDIEVTAEAASDETIETQPAELPPHSEVALKKLPAAVKTELNFAQNSVVIINDDGQHAGLLAEKLTAKGLIVAVVHAPQTVLAQQSTVNSDIRQITLDIISDNSISSALADIKTSGEIAGFIHLQPKVEASEKSGLQLSDQAFAQLESAFLWAKHLQPLLTQHSAGQFVTVSRIDGGFGYLNSHLVADTELNQSALSGLTKTLSHEWPGVRCRALDIAPELDSNQFCDAVMNELADPQTPVEVGVADDGRHTLIAGEKAGIRRPAAELSSTDKILVTGGAKGVTLKCALELAKQTQAHFILAGRSACFSESQLPAWAKGKATAELKTAAIAKLRSQGKTPTPKSVNDLMNPVISSREIADAINEFSKVGASAEYIALDVNNADSVRSTLETFNSITPVTGLIHGAGVLADKLIQDKTTDELARVYGAKVNGLRHILSASDPESLKLIALFSSAAGFYGNEGQSDYAMSNEILNKAALQLSQQLAQAKVVSFDWGPWDGGMVSDALKKMFIDRGVYVIPSDAGAQLFASKVLSTSASQLLIGSDMQGNPAAEKTAVLEVKKPDADLTATDLTLTLDPQKLGLIAHHKINGDPVLPTVCALQWLRRQAEKQLGGKLKVIDYRLLKGIVFDDQTLKTLSLKIIPEKNAYSAMIWCDNKPRYKARLAGLEPGETVTVVDAGRIAEYSISATELYQNGTLFHGPMLRGIERITHFDDSGLAAKIKLPQCGESGVFRATERQNVIAEDTLLQAVLVWARLKRNQASLPVSIGEFVCLSALNPNEAGELVLEIIKDSKSGVVANAALYHQNGELSCFMKQAKVTLSSDLDFEPHQTMLAGGVTH